ncbi:uncharacterized protein TRIADDRAFT_60705 [Trichoplax adhaerens]|uniref:Nephrocystin-3 n=1 Tax=Trichoplax adhaerens TaxID=10228 RepID=B3S956_TRIAD|nr:hypothetical protein TRIADDRAFT_60705 [Trichoplax adhaerens]EDV20741.1 hypothetical protein TRIADDRAFT_60705 [Trichoplax adhaerens]|eukprot:XP_002116682.1 hypothetical protein TRIADDRAFT_60705 [Trichoplax adhaerens]
MKNENIQSLRQLGYKALRLGHYCQAQSHYIAALNIINSLKTDRIVDKELECDLYLDVSIVLAKQLHLLQALEYCQRSQKLAGAINDQYRLAKLLDNQGNINRLQELFQKALDSYRAALKLKLKLCKSSNLDITDTFYGLGRVYYDQSKFNDALCMYQKAKDIRLQILGDDNLEIAELYYSIGNVLAQQRKDEEALSMHKKSLNIRIKLLEKKDLEIATSYQMIGLVYMNQRKIDDALLAYQQALDIRIEMKNDSCVEIAESQVSLGDIYYERSQYKDAEAKYRIALGIYTKLLHEDNQNLYMARLFNKIGNIFFCQYQFKEALSSYQKSLNIRLHVLGKTSLDVSDSYEKIGCLYIKQVNFTDGLSMLYKSLSIRSEIVGNDSLQVADSYFNFGATYYKEEKFTDALTMFQKCVDIQIKTYRELTFDITTVNHAIATVLTGQGESHLEVALSYDKIGDVYCHQLKYIEAMSMYRKSLNIRLAQLGENNLIIAESYDNIGKIHECQHDYDSALSIYEKSLTIRLEMLGKHNLLVSKSYDDIGNVCRLLYHYPKAITAFQQSLNIQSKVLGKDKSACKNAKVSPSGSGNEDLGKKLTSMHEVIASTLRMIRLQLIDVDNIGIYRSYRNFGVVRLAGTKYENSLCLFQKSRNVRYQIWGKNRQHYYLSCRLEKNDDHSRTEYPNTLSQYQRALQTLLKNIEHVDVSVANSCDYLGNICENIYRCTDALSLYQKSLEIRQQIFGENHNLVANSYDNIGCIYCNLSKYEEAIGMFNFSLRIRQKKLTNINNMRIAECYGNIAHVKFISFCYKDSLTMFEKFLEIMSTVLDGHHISTADVYNNIGVIKYHLSDCTEALKDYQASLDIRLALLGSNHRYVADSYYNIGMAYRYERHYDKAIESLQKSVNIYTQSLRPNHRQIVDVRRIIKIMNRKYSPKTSKSKLNIISKFVGNNARQHYQDLSSTIQSSVQQADNFPAQNLFPDEIKQSTVNGEHTKVPVYNILLYLNHVYVKQLCA